MKILLVNPGTFEDILTRVMRDVPYLGFSAFFAPHALAALAAATPAAHEVAIHDENVRGPVDNILDKGDYDVIGITLTTNQLKRTSEIIEVCRQKGLKAKLVVGGIGAGMMLTKLSAMVDSLFWGEAEDTWPLFLEDVAAGTVKPLYQRVAKPDMKKTLPPRWDLIAEDIPKYGVVSVQTSRGCPFDCNFCDVIYTYGRLVRAKPIENVLKEVELLNKLGAQMVMFADDNFAADRPYVKELLRNLVAMNNGYALPLRFLTQLDITIAEDEELLELLADANFQEVQIGIESIEPEALRDMNKQHNLKRDIPSAVKKIQSYGIVVMAHMIVGTDSDDLTTYQRNEAFMEEAGITHHQCHPLIAPAGTRMWYDFKRQGRLIHLTDEMRDRLDIVTNIIPKKMTRLELMEEMANYWDRVNSPEAYLKRALVFLNGITRMPNVKENMREDFRRNWKTMFKCFGYFLFKAGKAHRKAFLEVVKATQKKNPKLMPRMMYVHTGFLIDHLRALHTAAIARKQVAWEKEDPTRIKPLSSNILVSAAVREHMGDIARTAFNAVRPRVFDREPLYRLTLAAIVDYNNRFGAELSDFDEMQADHVVKSCERVLAAEQETPADRPSAPDPLDPSGKMPGGFTREMLDSLDRYVNVGSGGWEELQC